MKKRLAALVMFCICLGMTACGKKTESTVSMYDLQKTMLAADSSLPEMTTVNSNAEDAKDLFSYLSDFDYEKVNAFFLAYSSKGLADEAAVVECKNQADVEAVVKTLKDHVNSRVKLYSSYQGDQVERAKNALVFSEGKYAVLIISENQKEMQKAFLQAVGK